MKSKKAADVFFVLVFLAFIAAIAAVTIIKPKAQRSFYENRSLALQPEISFNAALGNNYSRRWERFFSDHAPGRASLITLGTVIDMNYFRRPVVNDVVIADNLYLGYNEFENVIPEKIQEQSKAIVGELSVLNDKIASYGGAFYHVAVPTQNVWYADKFPWYMNNRETYMEIALGAFVSDMTDVGINYIDMGEAFAGIADNSSIFCESDHHFTLRGAYEIYRTLINRINSDLAYGLPLLSPDDFSYETLENPFLGSRMRKLSAAPGITEHLEIAVLKEDIPFTRTDYGGLQDPPFIYSVPDDKYEVVDYGVYLGGDIGEIVFDTGRGYLPSVLVYGDSYTNSVECFLYTSCGVMRSVDLRAYGAMTLIEYVEKYKPDIVVTIRSYSALLAHDENARVLG